MFTMQITPRFCDTDALGHISNTIIPCWFEGARDPIFRLFSADLDPKKWQLILARYEIKFLAQLFYGRNVEVRTCLSHIGNSSMHILQQVWQDNTKAVEGTTVLVHFDYQLNAATPIPDPARKQLQLHLTSENTT